MINFITEYQLIKAWLRDKKVELTYLSIELPNGHKIIFV